VANGPIRLFDTSGAAALRSPYAVVAFGGWLDASSGGTGAVRFVQESLNAQKYGDIDPEDFYSFTDTRPLTSVVGPGQRALNWPRGEFYTLRLADDAEHDLVLFMAPEPNLKWRTFCSLLLDTFQELKVKGIVSLGSVFGAVHHRADIPLSGWATESSLREKLSRMGATFTNYEGPTGIVTALLAEAQARNVPSAALVGFTSNYVQGVPNPRTSLALLRALCVLTGIRLELTDLERSGRALARQIDRLLGEQPELRERVERMLNLASAVQIEAPKDEPEAPSDPENDPDRPPPGASVDLPTPQGVLNELEAFLKQLRETDNGPESGSEPESGRS
jgi:proteasome assembly chaperone (PAC2) family protein